MAHRKNLEEPSWFSETHAVAPFTVAYFSMEFALSEALPIYSGGLGILAGDYLKTASDLGVPVVGIGLLYQQGYFRQAIDTGGNQLEFYSYNDPSQLPVLPVRDPQGEWLRMALDFPGRQVRLRVWEASGTSGMKVLVNGGLNLSELDGWWAEAYRPEVSWALGDGQEHGDDPAWDAREAEQLYRLLEEEVIPAFYDRDTKGILTTWTNRMRLSMAELTPQFSTNQMVREYVEKLHLPAAVA
jgi:glucan phosphorylase